MSEQELAVEESPRVHTHPDSTAQVAEHPSLATILLSSQYPEIGLMTAPSPHISIQTLGFVASPSVQDQLVSTEQVEEQPSLLSVFPSSQ